MSAIRLGIVGFGRIVELTHLPIVKKLPQFAVTGVCDRTPERRALAEKRGFAVYAELEELLETDIQAVLVATPPSSHFAVAAAALKRGKHALIEKPVALSADQADELERLAADAGRIVTVFHNRRFDPDFQLVRSIIADGRLGSLRFVERRLHQFGSGAAFGVKSFHPGWRNESAYGGGALLDWGVHLLDQFLQLGLGSWRTVEASSPALRGVDGDAEQCVRSHITLDNGVVLSMDIHFGSHAASPAWIVAGDEGTLQISASGEATVHFGDNRPGDVPQAEGGGFRRDLAGTRLVYASFAEKVRGEGELAVTLAEAAEGMRLLEAVRLAAQSKKEVHNGHFVCGAPIGV